MKSIFKNTFAFTVGTFCLMTWAQVVVAQSGSRNTTYPIPQATTQQLQYAPVQGTLGASQSFSQPAERFAATQQLSVTSRVGFAQYDHRTLDSLLQKYVDRNGDVDYATWQSNAQDRATLLSYLQGMNSIDTSVPSSPQSTMAFWINAYNALTIEGILQLYPTQSIKDHAPNASGFNIWDDFKMPVGGAQYSLNDIEHKVLRKMGDPRIHFAIVCASKSCPQLSQRAYFRESLDQQLAYGSSLFFNTPGKFSYDLQRGQIGLSPIIQWFGEDFGRSDQERLQYLSQFMPAEAAQLATNPAATISYLDYDWGLNVAPIQTQFSGQSGINYQTLRPQQATTLQQLPTQIQPVQGSSTRGQIEAFQPTQLQPRCQRNGFGS